MAITQVTSVGLKDGEIVNADLHSSAAIALSKLGTSGTAGSGNFLRGDGAWSAIDLSAKLNTTGGTLTGDLTLSTSLPTIIFNDTDSENDFNIQNINGTFAIGDIDAGAARLEINSSGVATFRKNLNALEGLDVTGNITVTGTVDGVDIAARNTLFGGLTSSSGVLSNGVTATTQSASDNSTKVATTAYTDTAISNLVDSSPSALNTLNELAAALGDDANFSTTVTNSIATKAVLTGSTNNQITTVTGANAIQGESNLMWDGSNLAIGHNAPDPNWKTKILVAANASYQGGLNITNGTNSDFNVSIKNSVTAIGNGTNNPLVFFTNGSSNERLRIDSNGKVLIGTTTPQGNANADDLVISTSGTTGLTIRSGSTSHNGNIFFARGTSGVDEFRGWITYDHSQQHLTFGTNAQEIFRAFSGRFGIGTPSPTRTLEVRGPSDSHLAITVPGTTQTSALLFGDSGDDDVGAISYIHSDNSMRFVTGAAERLRIDSIGRLQIGASNNTGSNTKLVVGAGNNINTTAIINTGDVDTDALTLSNWDGSTATNKVMIAFDNSGRGGFNIGMPAATDSFVINDDGGIDRFWVDNSNGAFFRGANHTNIEVRSNDASTKAIVQTIQGSEVRIGASTNHGLAVYAGATERVRITAGGKVGINQTPTRELSVHSPDNNNSLIHFTNDDTGEADSDGIVIGLDGNEDLVVNNQESGKNIKIFNNTERIRIGPTGEIGVAGAGSIN